MEAKMTCLITASALILTYVHQPVREVEHGIDAVAMENLFGVSHVLPLLSNTVLCNESRMPLTKRMPLPWVRCCHKQSWFDTYHQTYDKDAANKDSEVAVPVYTNDNCWDYFWCHLDSFPAQ
jgi:hypothetical protein